MSEKSNILYSILASYKCDDVLNPSSTIYSEIVHYQTHLDPIFLDSTLSVTEACSILSKNKISSAPIFDKTAQKFIGQLDYFDLVSHVLQVLNDIPMQDRHNDWNIAEVLKKSSGTEHPLSSLKTHRGLVTIQKDSPLIDVLDEFVRSNAHRLAVMDQEKFIGIVSQSTIADLIVGKFGLRKEKGIVWPTGEKSLETLGVISTNIVSVKSTNTVLDALFRMHLNNVSSVAILDENAVYNYSLVARFDFDV